MTDLDTTLQLGKPEYDEPKRLERNARKPGNSIQDLLIEMDFQESLEERTVKQKVIQHSPKKPVHQKNASMDHVFEDTSKSQAKNTYKQRRSVFLEIGMTSLNKANSLPFHSPSERSHKNSMNSSYTPKNIHFFDFPPTEQQTLSISSTPKVLPGKELLKFKKGISSPTKGLTFQEGLDEEARFHYKQPMNGYYTERQTAFTQNHGVEFGNDQRIQKVSDLKSERNHLINSQNHSSYLPSINDIRSSGFSHPVKANEIVEAPSDTEESPIIIHKKKQNENYLNGAIKLHQIKQSSANLHDSPKLMDSPTISSLKHLEPLKKRIIHFPTFDSSNVSTPNRDSPTMLSPTATPGSNSASSYKSNSSAGPYTFGGDFQFGPFKGANNNDLLLKNIFRKDSGHSNATQDKDSDNEHSPATVSRSRIFDVNKERNSVFKRIAEGSLKTNQN